MESPPLCPSACYLESLPDMARIPTKLHQDRPVTLHRNRRDGLRRVSRVISSRQRTCLSKVRALNSKVWGSSGHLSAPGKARLDASGAPYMRLGIQLPQAHTISRHGSTAVRASLVQGDNGVIASTFTVLGAMTRSTTQHASGFPQRGYQVSLRHASDDLQRSNASH